MYLNEITRPALILDEHRCRRNIQRMVHKVSEQGILLRPHFKTHQSVRIGEWCRDEGIHAITVSSVGMAMYFANSGWNDITIAFPVNLREVGDIISLSSQIQVGLLVLDSETVTKLGKATTNELALWVKIDVGTHRTGLQPNDFSGIDQIIETIRRFPNLSFQGFLAHAGHSYLTRNKEEAKQVYDTSLGLMLQLKEKYVTSFPQIKISLGDTPGASMVDTFGEVDELRPGNFVFYDLMQQEIGACDWDDIAVALACPVVAIHPDRLQWIIYGGAIHFSKDFLQMSSGEKCFGRMVDMNTETWSVSRVASNPNLVSLSQEHGVVQCSAETFHLCKPGDISLWLPVHSCLTAEAAGEYVMTNGEKVDHFHRERIFHS